MIDLHTTTSNTKILLLMHNEDVISHAIAAHLMAIDADGSFVHSFGHSIVPELTE